MPLKLVLGTAVYSLGVVGGLKAMFKGLRARRDQRADVARSTTPASTPSA